jgi:uncharacterized SAM-binding protein YcdF (DUF218 family)
MLYLAPPVLLMTALFALFAPGFLYSENIPRRADAVVLFIGPDNVTRLDEANQLIRDGYARYLIIPSYDEVRVLNGQGEIERVSGMVPRGDLIHKVHMAAEYKDKEYYEHTHIEALEAKRMMDDLGLRSVMLVSSAYHMRRIKLIAGRVFDARRYDVSCNPARWQPQFTAGDWFDRARRKIIVSEYVKIAWFLAYGAVGS